MISLIIAGILSISYVYTDIYNVANNNLRPYYYINKYVLAYRYADDENLCFCQQLET